MTGKRVGPDFEFRRLVDTERLHDLYNETVQLKTLNTELLAALRAVLHHCVTVGGFPDKDKGRTPAQQKAYDSARAAIAEIEGEVAAGKPEIADAVCPTCGERHDASRGLSYDGHGVNSCDEYRSRIATFTGHGRASVLADCLGRQFAAAPKMYALLVERLADIEADAAASRDDPMTVDSQYDEIRAIIVELERGEP